MSNKIVFVEICAIHHEETLSVLITKIATNIVNCVNHILCTLLYYTFFNEISFDQKIQQ